MASSMFEFGAVVDASQYNAVATGHVAPVMGWEDTPNGRRPGTTPEIDEVTRAPFQIADVMLPLGRDGQPVLCGVRFAAHEVPKLEPYSPVELVGLRVKVRASRQGKGVDVTFAADDVRPVGPAADRAPLDRDRGGVMRGARAGQRAGEDCDQPAGSKPLFELAGPCGLAGLGVTR